MDNLKILCEDIKYDWFSLVSTFGKLGNNIKTKNKDKIKNGLITLICILLKIAYEHDIDMNHAWQHWNTKALSKQYD